MGIKVDDNFEKENFRLSNEENFSDEVSVDQLPGVQKAEAVTLVWGRKVLYFTYAWIWICFFMLAFHSSISANVQTYAYAEFSSASGISTINILASIFGGVPKLLRF